MTKDQEIIHWKNMVKMYKYDYLTGLKQRHDFESETIQKMLDKPFWLAMVDVTGLHEINRIQGYAAGDALIKQVANAVQHTDGLWEVYRIGGDEFMGVYFDKPSFVIPNATVCWVNSEDYEHFSDMMTDVDVLVTTEKKKLGRRRDDH